MSLRSVLLAAFGLFAATVVLEVRGVQDVPLKDVLTPDDVRKVGVRVRALGAPADPGLIDALAKLVKDNPGLNPEQLAKKLLEQRPDLLKPENAAQLQKLLGSLPGTPPAASTPAPTPAPTPGPTPAPPTQVPMTPEVVPPTTPPVEPPVGQPPVVPPMPPVTPPTTPATTPGTETPAPNVPSPGTVPPEQPGGSPAPVVPPPVAPPTAPPALPPARTEQEAQFRAATGWWEKNVGPINDSPAVKDMLAEFIKGAGTADGTSPLTSILKDLKGGPGGFKDWAKDALPKDFKFPDLGLGGVPKGFPTAPTLPTGGPPAAPSFDFGGLGGSWLPVLLGVVALAAFGYFVARPWWRDRVAGPTPTAVPGLGPWPLDPRSVTSREALVRAFDYLSVLTLGGAARQYNHLTIAGELRRRVPAADDVADELGRLYAVARYTPPGEPIATADIAAARAALCRLAGVPA